MRSEADGRWRKLNELLSVGTQRMLGKRGWYAVWSKRMRQFLIRWLCTTIAVAVAVKLTGMQAAGWSSLIGTALFLGIINALVRPVVLLLSLPFIVATLGLFILVINAIMLAIAGSLVPGFSVGGFGNAFVGAIIVSLVSWVLSLFFRASDGHYHLITHHEQVKRVQGRVIE